jgi:aminoglycoside phosphotransferase (APT) family kinase protein
VVHWEMARIGDPAWDPAGLMVRPLLGSTEVAWGAANERAAATLLAAYAAASRLSLPALAQRLVLYCGVWLLMSLLQSRSVAPATDDEATERLLGRAAATFSECDRQVARLLAAEAA